MANNRNRDFIDRIAPDQVIHISPPLEKEFKPWHKPRKQWVRLEQWRNETERLLGELNLDGRPLRYLSLPGKDMLDIRVFAQLCQNKGIQLKCLGYDESVSSDSDQTEVSISWNEVSNQIQPTSIILPDNISVLKNKGSHAFSYIKKLGSFDVVNLDFCQSISSFVLMLFAWPLFVWMLFVWKSHALEFSLDFLCQCVESVRRFVPEETVGKNPEALQVPF